MPNPLQVISRSRAELERVDTAALYQLIAAYAPMKGRVDARIDALLAEIEAMENPTVASVRRLSSFRTLSSDIDDGMSGYVQFLIIALGAAATQGIDLGVRHGADILAAYEAGSVYRVSPDAVRVALQFLEPTGALMDRIRMLAPYTAEQVRRSILDGIAQGLNPRTIATNVTRSFGIGLTDSMRMLRTAQIYSYRYANHASYLANGIESWVWVSRLDPARSCPSCVAKHGTIHPATETLQDHHNGLCLAAPVAGGYNPVNETGEEWFSQQSAATQMRMLGKGRYEAWSDGKFPFDALSKGHEDAVYGTMFVATPLKELVP